ncbi:hypothetical protein DFP72DRAFT_1070845 [Ephemerocybe angulata]|uniref:Uncharacterized protein n=1 Tax=Ephemerocybe angulata TaxID=980116 RepID=A0A8H6HSW5_9AGAR|nr:hypothetical protein DFP72DRAFT_1070845 [Tulosesus angulatus]
MPRSRSNSSSSRRSLSPGDKRGTRRHSRSASPDRRGPPGGFRMSTGGRAIAKWLEAKQRRLNGTNDDSFSIVTTGDEEPVKDRDDKAYRARSSGRSRITSAQANRDVTPIRTRNSTRKRVSSNRVERSTVEASANAEEDGSSSDDSPPGEDKSRSPAITPPPPLPKAWARYAKKVQLAALLARYNPEDPDDALLNPPSSKKRGRSQRKKESRTSSLSPLSKKRRRQPQPFPIPPLSPDIEFPSMTDILQASRSNGDTPTRKAAAGRHARLQSPPVMRFFDDEAVEDDGSVASSEEEVMELNKDEYDYADSFIDDGSESDVSMKSLARTRKKHLPAKNQHRERTSDHDEDRLQSYRADGNRRGTDKSKRSSGNRSTHRTRAPHPEVLEITSDSSDAEEDDHVVAVEQSSAPVLHDVPSKSKPRPRPIPKRVSAPADPPITPVAEGGEPADPSITPVAGEASSAPRERSPSFGTECANIFNDDVLTREERELMLRALLLSREERKRSTTSKSPIEASTPDSATVRESTDNVKANVKSRSKKNKGKARARQSPSPPPTHPKGSTSKDKGKGRALRTPSPPPLRLEESDDELSPYERAQLEKAMAESRRVADSPHTPGETSAQGATGSSSSSTRNVPPPSTPPTPSGGPSVTMQDLVRRLETVSEVIADPPPAPAPAVPTAPAHPFVEDMSTVRRCTALPGVDETANKAIRDAILRLTYAKLCNLRRGRLNGWSDAVGPGQIEFSVWGEWIANLNANIAFDCVTFDEEGPIRNPARASPLDIAMRTVPGSNQRYNFYCATNPAVPLTAVSCGWLERSQLVAPSETGLRQKYVTVIFHTQEWERTIGFIRTASGYPELYAQLSRDALQFSTRSQSTRAPTSPGDTPPKKTRTAPSKLFRKAPQASNSSNSVAADNFSLPNDAEVPVYDARNAKSLDFHAVLPNLSKALPRYTGGEIPKGSFVMVGYTMTIYRANNGNWTLGCNLQWVIVIGIPED